MSTPPPRINIGSPLLLIPKFSIMDNILNNQVLKLAPFFRTIIFMPVVTAIAIIGIVMTFVFSPFNGPANKFLMGMNTKQFGE